jgi:hypothetical protein
MHSASTNLIQRLITRQSSLTVERWCVKLFMTFVKILVSVSDVGIRRTSTTHCQKRSRLSRCDQGT